MPSSSLLLQSFGSCPHFPQTRSGCHLHRPLPTFFSPIRSLPPKLTSTSLSLTQHSLDGPLQREKRLDQALVQELVQTGDGLHHGRRTVSRVRCVVLSWVKGFRLGGPLSGEVALIWSGMDRSYSVEPQGRPDRLLGVQHDEENSKLIFPRAFLPRLAAYRWDVASGPVSPFLCPTSPA